MKNYLLTENPHWKVDWLTTITRSIWMKVCFVLISVLCAGLQLTMAHSVLGQGLKDEKVNLDIQEQSLSVIFKEIERQTSLHFAYNPKLVEQYTATISGNPITVEEVLQIILDDTPLAYNQINDKILITRAKHPNSIPTELLQIRTPLPRLEQMTAPVINISGTVTDQNGEALIGVNIQVKGTTKGTITDFDGRYSLDDVDEQAILVFSYIGFQSQEVPVAGKSTIDIVLLPDAQLLDEVIVVGYGTVKKSDLTGSVTRISGEDFKRQPITQLTEMLAGTVSGFYSQQSASPGGGGSMEIRGQNSLSARTNPMIVLDGVIFNGSLQEINPNDIESIDILKDASSSAIFGARAAAGIILVTTKKGSVGAPTINFSTKIGFSNPTSERKPLGPEEYLQFREDFFTEGILNDPGTNRYYYTNPNNLPSDISVEEWLNFRDNHNQDPINEWTQRLNLFSSEQENYLAGRTVDWYDKVMNLNALRQNYDLSVRGGTEKIRYYWSLGYLNNEGMITGQKYAALQSRLNLDVSLNDWLSVGMNGQFTNRDDGGGTANLARMYIVSPYGNFRNEDGSLTLFPHEYVGGINPMTDYYGRDQQRKTNSIFTSLYTNVKLPFGINYKFSFQPRLSYTDDFIFDGPESSRGISLPEGFSSRANQKIYEWMVDNLLTWNKTFGVHNLDLTFLYNVEEYQSWYNIQSNQNFTPNAKLGFHALQFGDNPSISNSDTRQTGDALMGRLNYSLMDKYLFTASLRRDGYSAFGQEQPRAIFPAFAFAWKLSDENFYNNEALINRLKLRLSWGVNGNREIGAYSALSTLSSLKSYDGSKVIIGVQNSSLANSGLVWEKSTSFNVGADIGLLDDRIGVTADFYIGHTNDLLLNRLLPIITGFSNVTSNLGELKNQGFELSINTTNIHKARFSWGSNLVFSFNRNKIVSLFGDKGDYTLLGESRSGELPDFSNQWFPGYAVDAVWNYNILGIWQESEADEAAAYNMVPGDIKGEDVDGDGKYIDVNDKQFIGHTVPRYLFGLQNTFDWGPWSASMFIRADLGHLIPLNEALGGTLTHDRNNFNNGPMPYWTPENQNNTYPRLRPVHTAYGGGIAFYEPGSFVRLQDVSISYNLPESFYRRLQMSGMSVYVSSRNLLTFDKFIGWDPESRMTPMPRTISFGLDITL